MTAWLHALFAWLADYAALATLLLAAALMAGSVLRQPVQRVFLAWATLVGLAILAAACATPFWPRIALVAISTTDELRIADPVPPSNVAPSQNRSINFTPTIPIPSDASRWLRHSIADHSPAMHRADDDAAISPPVANPPPALPTDWPALAAGAFLFVVSVVSSWLILGACRTRRLCRCATPAPQFARTELHRLISGLPSLLTGEGPGVRGRPRLLVSHQIDIAAALGLRRPTILLPAQAVQSETGPARQSLRTLLAHEWAHIRRGDLWLLALSRSLLLMLALHPLYWLLRRRIRADQELIADALAAEACGRTEYAETLVAWARRLPPPRFGLALPGLSPGLGIWERPGQLSRRIAMLLDERIRLDTRCSRRWRFSIALVAAALVGGTSLFTLRPAAIAEADTPAEKVSQINNAPAADTATIVRPTDRATFGAWSQPVDGLQARLFLKRSHVSNGTPIISTFIELRNVSNVANPMRFPWMHQTMKYRVVDANGTDLPAATGPYSGAAGPYVTEVLLPVRATLSFDISAGGMGIPGDQAALIDLGPQSSWVFDRDDRAYFLHAVLDVAASEEKPGGAARPWHGRIEIPKVELPLKRHPLDAATAGALIDEWGPKMLDKSSDVSDEAVKILSCIDDPRVIPWYLKAIDTDRYDLKYAALDRLGRLPGDEALAGLKKGMRTQGTDMIATCTTQEVADQCAINIRHSAALALARSPHPDAKALLWSMWNDPASAVKITVLHALGKMTTPESLELLRKMSDDKDARVRDEALRYLQLRQAQADAGDRSDATSPAKALVADAASAALPEKIAIPGKCMDEKYKPLAGVRVRLFAVDYTDAQPDGVPATDRQRELRETQSDAQGKFEFRDVPAGGAEEKIDVFFIVGQAKGRATAVDAYHPTAPDFARPPALVLPPAGALTGRVTNAQGQPVAGALVGVSGLLRPVPGIKAALTDADGRYSINDLGVRNVATQTPQRRGDGLVGVVASWGAAVRHPDYATQPFLFTKVPGTVDVKIDRAAVVEGRVTLAESDQPAAGVQLEFSRDNGGSARAETDADGHYRLDTLPPGAYKLSAELKDRANLFRFVPLKTGVNKLDLPLERGAVLKGRVIDVTTGQPAKLNDTEKMSISPSLNGVWHYGMGGADIQPDGTFTLRLPSGKNHLGMYFGPKWRGVNTDRLSEKGIELANGETKEIEIRVKPRTAEDDKPPQPLNPQQAAQLSEQAAIAAIKQLGGWTESQKIDGQDHVVEVNMVYHEDDEEGRQENRLVSDECLSYVGKFPHLRRLMLHRGQATDKAMANLRGLKNLEAIYIWDASSLTDAGTTHLAGLSKLKMVHIDNGQITDKSLRTFSQLPKLESLSLQGNNFSDRGLEFLKAAKQLKSVWVGLGKGKISDAGLRHLSALTNLEEIELTDSDITDAGLMQLRGLKNLKCLMPGDKITPEGFGKLRKVLPKLKDSFNPEGDESNQPPPGKDAETPQPADAPVNQLMQPAADRAATEPAAETEKVSITGVCLDDNGKPVAQARLMLFRLERGDSIAVRPNGRLKLVSSIPDATMGDNGQMAYGGAYAADKQRLIHIDRADAEGKFEFADLAADSAWRDQSASIVIVAQTPGRATISRPVMIQSRGPQDPPSVAPLELLLQKPATLSGRVTNTDGQPVTGAMVSCPWADCLSKPVPGICCAVSDADGKYEIKDLTPMDVDELPPSPVPSLGIISSISLAASVEHPNYAAHVAEFTKLPATADAVLQKPAGVKGQITGQQGQPVAKCVVNCSRGDGFSITAWSDEQGRYTLGRLQPGKYTLRASTTELPPVSQEIELKAGENTLDVRLAAGGVLKGRVIDDATGQPLQVDRGAQIYVMANLANGNPAESCQTAVQEDGTFSMTVKAGQNGVVFWRPNYQLIDAERWQKAGVEVAAGKTVEIELRVQQNGFFFGAPHRRAPLPLPKEPMSAKAILASLKAFQAEVQTETIDGQEHVVGISGVDCEQAGSEFDAGWLEHSLLARIDEFPKLRTLFLHTVREGDTALAALEKNKSIEQFGVMIAPGLTSAGVAHLATMPNLKTVYLAAMDSKLDDEALQHLARAPKLETLVFSGSFTDSGIAHLRNKKSLTGLVVMNQGAAQLTDQSLTVIGGLENLEHLNLEASGFTDAGLQNLSKLSKLKDLALSGERITDAGLAHLRNLKNLESVDLQNTAVTQQGIEQLQKALPKAKIKSTARDPETPTAP